MEILIDISHDASHLKVFFNQRQDNILQIKYLKILQQRSL